MSTTPDVSTVLDWVAGVWPVDGPHTPQRVQAAGAAVGELARYLAHATRTDAGLPYAGQLYGLVGSLQAASAALTQTCDQLGLRLVGLAADPTLRHDRGVDPAPVARLAAECAERAAQDCALLGQSLELLHTNLSPLGHDVPPAQGGRR